MIFDPEDACGPLVEHALAAESIRRLAQAEADACDAMLLNLRRGTSHDGFNAGRAMGAKGMAHAVLRIMSPETNRLP